MGAFKQIGFGLAFAATTDIPLCYFWDRRLLKAVKSATCERTCKQNEAATFLADVSV